jgi:hypothetical protein
MTYCTKCGQQVEPGTRFCRRVSNSYARNKQIPCPRILCTRVCNRIDGNEEISHGKILR